MEARHIVFTVHLTDLQPVQIIEVGALSLALAPKDVDVVIDDATGVAVAALWHLAGLAALNPSKEFVLAGLMSALGSGLLTVCRC